MDSNLAFGEFYWLAHESSVGLSSTTSPKPRGITLLANTCSGIPMLTKQKAEETLSVLGARLQELGVVDAHL